MYSASPWSQWNYGNDYMSFLSHSYGAPQEDYYLHAARSYGAANTTNYGQWGQPLWQNAAGQQQQQSQGQDPYYLSYGYNNQLYEIPGYVANATPPMLPAPERRHHSPYPQHRQQSHWDAQFSPPHITVTPPGNPQLVPEAYAAANANVDLLHGYWGLMQTGGLQWQRNGWTQLWWMFLLSQGETELDVWVDKQLGNLLLGIPITFPEAVFVQDDKERVGLCEKLAITYKPESEASEEKEPASADLQQGVGEGGAASPCASHASSGHRCTDASADPEITSRPTDQKPENCVVTKLGNLVTTTSPSPHNVPTYSTNNFQPQVYHSPPSKTKRRQTLDSASTQQELNATNNNSNPQDATETPAPQPVNMPKLDLSQTGAAHSHAIATSHSPPPTHANNHTTSININLTNPPLNNNHATHGQPMSLGANGTARGTPSPPHTPTQHLVAPAPSTKVTGPGNYVAAGGRQPLKEQLPGAVSAGNKLNTGLSPNVPKKQNLGLRKAPLTSSQENNTAPMYGRRISKRFTPSPTHGHSPLNGNISPTPTNTSHTSHLSHRSVDSPTKRLVDVMLEEKILAARQSMDSPLPHEVNLRQCSSPSGGSPPPPPQQTTTTRVITHSVINIPQSGGRSTPTTRRSTGSPVSLHQASRPVDPAVKKHESGIKEGMYAGKPRSPGRLYNKRPLTPPPPFAAAAC